MAGEETASANGGLLAILLVTRSRPGPELVFHYPPHPRKPLNNVHRRTKRADVTSTSDSDSETEDDRAVHATESKTLPGPAANEENTNQSPEQVTSVASSDISTTLFGYSHDSLEKLLSPARWCDRKRFEVCLDDLTFVGHPVFARQDGKWSKHDRAATAPATRPDSTYDAGYDYYGIEQFANITITKPEPELQARDFAHDPDSYDSRAELSAGTSANSGDTGATALMEQLSMFHVVFVLSPASTVEAENLYQQIARPLSEALRYCQKQSMYIARESRRMQTALSKAKVSGLSQMATWAHLLDISELAWALREVYDKISKGQVAGIRLCGNEVSLQAVEPSERNGVMDELSPHSGLLLLEDKEVLLRQLGHPEASVLAHFISDHLPTKSLQKLSTQLGLPLNDLKYLAGHLIKWRKARSIAPLHARNVYVIAPDAPFAELERHSAEYTRRFPALPSLPRMLKVLGGKPVQYRAFIPSKDHRQPFMEVLAWLVKERFVVQVETVGWFRVPEHTPKPEDERRESLNTTASGRSVSLLSPHLRPTDDDTKSVSSELTAIPTGPKRSSDAKPIKPAGKNSLVIDPRNPKLDLRFLRSLMSDQDLSSRLDALVPYFDGEHVLEEIAGREGLKRAKVDSWLEWLEQHDLLLRVRRAHTGSP